MSSLLCAEHSFLFTLFRRRWKNATVKRCGSKNVRSLTFRLFTDKEDAQNHCNVGNGQLAIDVICDWIEQTEKKYID